jgi:hypothetical protein
MIRIATIAAWVVIAVVCARAAAEALSPALVFEGKTMVQAKDGTTQSAHVSVQSWRIAGPEEELLPLRVFYIAHLLSGQIRAKIDGQTIEHLPGDYWTVNAGVVMRVKAVGEVAVLETIVVAK